MAIEIDQFRQTVSTSGAGVQLTSDSKLRVASVIITADPSNSGTIYVGSSDVDAPGAIGQPINANESITLEPPTYYGTDELLDLTKIYIDSTSNGDAVAVTFYKRSGE